MDNKTFIVILVGIFLLGLVLSSFFTGPETEKIRSNITSPRPKVVCLLEGTKWSGGIVSETPDSIVLTGEPLYIKRADSNHYEFYDWDKMLFKKEDVVPCP